ncbi:MAG TPA: RimK family alpha-L-glutamate ligase [Candidatus Methanoperedens sp.]|nr:RimK family alpha-L-glutamate ligase [Candidatus Methanoperedens sp.]HLB70082.1 RimK family alpha-L-glutamate ligase [Candidatus Methanoperedens sp.]
MKRIGIAVTDPEDWTGMAFCRAVRHYDMQPVKFSFDEAISNIASGKIYAGSVDLNALDAVIVRDMGPATNNDASFRFDILCQLRENGALVINSPESIARAANKYVSSYLFQKNGISTPETEVTSDLKEALSALSCFERAVVKPVFGYKGIGVECVRNDEKGVRRLGELFGKNKLLYIQKFIQNPGRDIRVFVVNRKVMGSIYRFAPSGSLINNLSQGGTAEPCTLTEEQERLGLKAAEVIGAVYAGVDIMEGDKDYVIEINGTPSGRGIFGACGVDVTMRIVEYLNEVL